VTRLYTIPRPRTPRAVLRIFDPDGRVREVAVEDGSLTIGRGIDNDLVAVDGRVSRHHGRIVGRRGTLVYEDLGSTNGSRVNGEPVTEVVLGVGDRLEVGDTALVVEVAGAPD
jgi:pSer/pThr/pTyr-binding forkhead associated (FHA) protein